MFLLGLIVDLIISAVAGLFTYFMTNVVVAAWLVAILFFIVIGIAMLAGPRGSGGFDDFDFGDFGGD